MTTISPGKLIRSFFEDYLICQKGLSAATIRSYRDALRLFLLFVVTDSRCRLSRLTLSEFTSQRVIGFLNSLETQRHNHVRTRNQRLSALRVFFDYLASRIPEMRVVPADVRDLLTTD